MFFSALNLNSRSPSIICVFRFHFGENSSTRSFTRKVKARMVCGRKKFRFWNPVSLCILFSTLNKYHGTNCQIIQGISSFVCTRSALNCVPTVSLNLDDTNFFLFTLSFSTNFTQSQVSFNQTTRAGGIGKVQIHFRWVY